MGTLNRRQFVKQAGGMAGAGATFTFLERCASNDIRPGNIVNFTIDLTSSSSAALQNVGGAIVKNGVIIIRKSSTEYVALSTVCTHESCTVNYNSSSNRLVCPCHGSIFSNSGQVIQGPATSPLPSYSTSVAGDVLTVKS